jgi:Mg2+ and Co2+ transporter CorA
MFGDPSSTNHYHPAVLDSPHKHSPSTFFDETHNPHLQALIDEAKQQDLQLPQPPSPPTSDQHHDTTRQAEKNQVNHLDHIDSDEKAMESLMLWFSIHDLDSNDLLDGHELLKVFAEWAVQGRNVELCVD